MLVRSSIFIHGDLCFAPWIIGYSVGGSSAASSADGCCFLGNINFSVALLYGRQHATVSTSFRSSLLFMVFIYPAALVVAVLNKQI